MLIACNNRTNEDLKVALMSGEQINDRILSIEKLFCDPWLNDGNASKEIYSSWEKAKLPL